MPLLFIGFDLKIMKNKLLTGSEHLIQEAVKAWCLYHHIYVWRSNSGRFPIGEGNNRRMVIGSPTGTPDLIGVIGPNFAGGKYVGRMIALEIKKPSNKPTDIQNRVMTELAQYGAIVWVIHSVEELEEKMKSL